MVINWTEGHWNYDEWRRGGACGGWGVRMGGLVGGEMGLCGMFQDAKDWCTHIDKSDMSCLYNIVGM